MKHFQYQNQNKINFIRTFIPFAVYSTGDFLFYAMGPDTYCSETVTYQCPPFLGPVCRREVDYQRKMIMRNLLIRFNKNQ